MGINYMGDGDKTRVLRKRRQLPTRLHLPDCNTLAFARKDTADTRKCDCGKPPGILPAHRTIVRRYSPKRDKVALVVVSKSEVLVGEEDLAESRLLFEAEADRFIREQQRKDDQKQRRSQATKMTSWGGSDG